MLHINRSVQRENSVTFFGFSTFTYQRIAT